MLAAVHFTLLGELDHPLAGAYPTVAEVLGRDGTGPALGSEDLFAAFRDFCLDHEDALAALLRTRRTQTNEVGRCTALLPAYAHIADRIGKPLGLADLGASAGLSLLFDQFGYQYEPGPVVGHSHAAVQLPCEVYDGPLPALAAMPPVPYRVAIDQCPLDPDDEADARWLLACQWPDHLERFRRTRAALAVARDHPERPRVRRAEMIEAVGPLVAAMPEEVWPCMVHTWVAAYLGPEEQRALVEAIDETGRSRDLSWLFAESPYEVPELPMPSAPSAPNERRQPDVERQRRAKAATALVLVEWRGGRRTEHRLADLHPHGRWLSWWGSDR